MNVIKRAKMVVRTKTHVFAKCFEDNAGCLALAKEPKLRPRTKHTAIKYHHFLSYAETEENPNRILHLHWVSTDKQQADAFTTSLKENLFVPLRKLICGW